MLSLASLKIVSDVKFLNRIDGSVQIFDAFARSDQRKDELDADAHGRIISFFKTPNNSAVLIMVIAPEGFETVDSRAPPRKIAISARCPPSSVLPPSS